MAWQYKLNLAPEKQEMRDVVLPRGIRTERLNVCVGSTVLGMFSHLSFFFFFSLMAPKSITHLLL